MAVRVQLLFNAPPFGWSETHWHTQAPYPEAALGDAEELGATRLELVEGTHIRLVAIRLSRDEVGRDVLLSTKFSEVVPPTLPPRLAGRAERPYSTALLRLEAGARYRGFQHLSGLNQLVLADPPGPDFTVPRRAARGWRHFTDLLQGGTWGLRAIQQPGDGVESYPITELDTDVHGRLILTAPLNNFGAGMRVRIRGLRTIPRHPALNGTHTISEILDGDRFTLVGVSGARELLREGEVWSYLRVCRAYTRVLATRQTPKLRGKPWRALSWEIVEEELRDFLNPCGMVMDYGRTPYTRSARVYTDDPRHFTLRWYPAPRGADVFPAWHRFASGDWADGLQPWPYPGEEQTVRRKFFAGKPRPVYLGKCYTGRLDWFRHGPELIDRQQPEPVCQACRPPSRASVLGALMQAWTRLASAIEGPRWDCCPNVLPNLLTLTLSERTAGALDWSVDPFVEFDPMGLGLHYYGSAVRWGSFTFPFTLSCTGDDAAGVVLDLPGLGINAQPADAGGTCSPPHWRWHLSGTVGLPILGETEWSCVLDVAGPHITGVIAGMAYIPDEGERALLDYLAYWLYQVGANVCLLGAPHTEKHGDGVEDLVELTYPGYERQLLPGLGESATMQDLRAWSQRAALVQFEAPTDGHERFCWGYFVVSNDGRLLWEHCLRSPILIVPEPLNPLVFSVQINLSNDPPDFGSGPGLATETGTVLVTEAGSELVIGPAGEVIGGTVPSSLRTEDGALLATEDGDHFEDF